MAFCKALQGVVALTARGGALGHNGGMAPYRILVVCTGNICRSPMGQQVLTEALGEDAVVDSVGISAEEHGNPVDRRANAALARHGHRQIHHAARQVRPDDLRDADLVLAMTSRHLSALRRLADQHGIDPAKIRLWREFDPAAPKLAEGARESDLDIDDPWYGGDRDFDVALAQIDAGVPGIVDHVRGDS